jgi:hypothetical protein
MLVILLVICSLNLLGLIYVLLVLNSAFKFTNNRIDFFMSQQKTVIKKAEEVITAFRKMTKTITNEANQ